MSLLIAAFVVAQTSITPAEAKAHIGEVATVCGKVMSSRFAESSSRQPTFLNLDQPSPKQIFTVVIFGTDRPKFGEPEKELATRRSPRGEQSRSIGVFLRSWRRIRSRS
jgi:hypothetical protein